MSQKSPFSFSKIANAVLASVSSGDGGKPSAAVCLKGKLDLSLWKQIGNEDDDEELDQFRDDASPLPAPSPILIPLLAAKKSAPKVDDKIRSSDDSRKGDLCLFSLSTHLLASKHVQPAEKSQLLSPPRSTSPPSIRQRSSGEQGESEEGGIAVEEQHQHEEQEKPQESGSRWEKLPPILLRMPASSTTTAALLSSFIAGYQLSSGSQYASGGGTVQEEEVGAAHSTKKVEFAMDTSAETEKGRRSGSGKDGSTIRSRSGSAVPTGRRPSSRTQPTDILQEIRKMSLASQDEQKKKQGPTVDAPSSGRKFGKKLKKKRKAEEVFTDKDRAAAVTLGSRDIKQSLKAKKKRDRKMRLSISFISGENYVIGTLLGEANYQMRVKKQPEAALQTLNKALEIQPRHKGALVARSQCYLKLGDAEAALSDAQQTWDPSNPNETYTQGLYQYAEALYQLGEFEQALIAFHRGNRSRKDMDGFRIGIQKCQEAIRRAIGDKNATSIPNLDRILPLIQDLEEAKSRMSPEQRKETEQDPDDSLLKNIARCKLGEGIQLSTAEETKVKSKLITRELMGQLYLDKSYLKKFIHRPEVINQQGIAKGLRDEACEALKYLESRERFWRQQNPLYSRKNFATMLKAHAYDMAFKEKSVSEEPSVAKYLQRRRSSTFNFKEPTPPPISQQRRRSSEPRLNKAGSPKVTEPPKIGDEHGQSQPKKVVKKTPSTESSKGRSHRVQ